KYVRVWTPLGKNALRIDNDKNQSLPLEVLSRGTREAVFIALRLSLAAAYSRRGVTLPLVLDDVLVNFDTIRARSAAKVLQDFAALGHQVVMFTCHEHIMRMFHDIHVQVRVLPAHGQSGEARIYQPHDVPVVVPVEPAKIVVPPVVPVLQSEPVIEIALEPMVEEPEWVAEYSHVEPETTEQEITEANQPVEVKRPIRKKPRRQVAVPVVVEQEFVEPNYNEPFSLWYEEESVSKSEPQEPTDRLWNELDRIDLPLEGEPHDLWWSQARE
ncbi:MAG: ATP-binding protein, partial [Pirellula sp.]